MSGPIFMIVGKNDQPLYEADFSPVQKKENSHLFQFIIHAALDFVDEGIWTSPMLVRNVDRFNELGVSSFTSAGQMRFMLLHDARSEDGIKSFFHDVYETYVKIVLNPFYVVNTKISSAVFDQRVRALAKKYLG